MKFLSLAFLLLPLPLLAATFRVNNAPDTAPDYTTIQAAINAAADGDTILIEGSTSNYAPFTVLNKRLSLIGPGYGLGANLGTPANKLSATISGGTSYVRTSLASGGSANGTLVMSMFFVAELNLDTCTNVTVARCLFDTGSSRLTVTGPSNVITQCYFRGNGACVLSTGSTGTRIENSLLTTPVLFPSTGTFTFKNNAMYSVSNSILFFTFDNNIFLNAFTSSGFSNSTFSNNLFAGSVPLSLNGSGNLAYSSITAIMADYLLGSGSPELERRYQLLPLSAANPAYNAGTDGTHIGPFGGANPYILSGVPPLPSIDELSVPQFAAPGGNLTIRVKVSERP
jgi:hypothetical protein